MGKLTDIEIFINQDRLEEGTAPACRSAATDRDVLASLRAEFEFRNEARRVAARILGKKNDGFPTISLKAMLAKAKKEYNTRRK